jgi:crossover junction endodeoxyribonuclease RuvC
MNTIGIDPGTLCLGFSVMSNEQRTICLQAAGCLILPPKAPLPERLKKIYDFLKEKIVEEKVNAIAIETPFLGKNVQNFLKLGYVRGIIYLLSQEHKLALSEFSPKEVKKAVTGSGSAEKEQVSRALQAFFPMIKLEATTKHDITDAIAVAFCGIIQNQFSKK